MHMAVNFQSAECGHANEHPKHEQGALTNVDSMVLQDFAPLAPKLMVGLCTPQHFVTSRWIGTKINSQLVHTQVHTFL